MAFLKLFLIFLRIGFFSFGGGYAMLPLIYEAARDFGLMSGTQFSDLVALSQVTPGPIAINAATYVGYQYAGIGGAASATAGIVMPSFVLIFLVSHFLRRFKESETLNGILSGIRPATMGLLGSAAIFLAQESMLVTTGKNLIPILFFCFAVFLFGKVKANPILLTLLGGAAGAFLIR